MEIFNPKPSFYSVEKSDAEMQSSTVTYNESSIQYNSLIMYGGSDRRQSMAPIFSFIDSIVPNMDIVRTPTTSSGTVTLAAGQSMGLLLALTYPTTTSYTT